MILQHLFDGILNSSQIAEQSKRLQRSLNQLDSIFFFFQMKKKLRPPLFQNHKNNGRTGIKPSVPKSQSWAFLPLTIPLTIISQSRETWLTLYNEETKTPRKVQFTHNENSVGNGYFIELKGANKICSPTDYTRKAAQRFEIRDNLEELDPQPSLIDCPTCPLTGLLVYFFPSQVLI